MKLEWNKVTWYSKLGALILFLLVVPALTFYIGREYEKTSQVLNDKGPILPDTSHIQQHISGQKRPALMEI